MDKEKDLANYIYRKKKLSIRNTVDEKFNNMKKGEKIKIKIFYLFIYVIIMSISAFIAINSFFTSDNKNEDLIIGIIFSIIVIYFLYKIVQICITKTDDFIYQYLLKKTKKEIYKYTDNGVTYDVYTEQSSKKFLNKFHLDQSIDLCDLFHTSFKIDNTNKLFYFCNDVFKSRIYKFKNIEEYGLYENNKLIYFYDAYLKASNSSYFSKDYHSDTFFVSDLKIVITLNDDDSSQIIIPYIIDFYVDKRDTIFQYILDNLKKDLDLIDNLLDEVSFYNDLPANEKLKKLKDLLDNCFISDEEYEKLKKKILKL